MSVVKAALVGLFSAALLAACADQSGALGSLSSDKGVADGSGPNTPLTSQSAPPLLHQMEDAFLSTHFYGERRYSSRFEGQTLELVEEVGGDGSGHFAYEILDVVSVPVSIDPNGFAIESENAWRFAMMVRDPRVVNADSLALNYAITTLPETPTVANIECIRLSMQRHSAMSDRPGHYEADVDPNTGFALAWREFDTNGQILNSLAYESFEYGGDLSGMTLKARAFDAVPIAMGQPLGPQVSFPSHLPNLPTEGFEFVGGEVMTVPASLVAGIPAGEKSYLVPGEWLRVIATDGLESIIFTHSAAAATGPAVAGELRISSELGWKIGFGRIDSMSYVIAARAPLSMVERIVASAF